ncbi:hypothetical protein Tco_1035597, partial [Tanacetum coccineum]
MDSARFNLRNESSYKVGYHIVITKVKELIDAAGYYVDIDSSDRTIQKKVCRGNPSEILGLDNVIEGSLWLLATSLSSDHRLVEDHEKRPMGIFWNLYMSLMYADDLTFAKFSLCAKDLHYAEVYSWSSKLYTFYISVCITFCKFALSKIDLPAFQFSLYMEFATGVFHVSAFGINGSFGVLCWIVISANGFNTISILENLSDNWTDAISGVSLRSANSDNG